MKTIVALLKWKICQFSVPLAQSGQGRRLKQEFFCKVSTWQCNADGVRAWPIKRCTAACWRSGGKEAPEVMMKRCASLQKRCLTETHSPFRSVSSMARKQSSHRSTKYSIYQDCTCTVLLPSSLFITLLPHLLLLLVFSLRRGLHLCSGLHFGQSFARNIPSETGRKRGRRSSVLSHSPLLRGFVRLKKYSSSLSDAGKPKWLRPNETHTQLRTETEWDFNKRVYEREIEAEGTTARVHGKLNWVCRVLSAEWWTVTEWLWLVQICTGAHWGVQHQPEHQLALPLPPLLLFCPVLLRY